MIYVKKLGLKFYILAMMIVSFQIIYFCSFKYF